MSRRAIVAAVCLAAARPVYADDRGLAVLVGPSDGDPIVLKISDELRALGFEVEVAPHGSDRDRIRSRARRNDAVAVVLVDKDEIEVRVVVGQDVEQRHIPRRRDTDMSTNALAAVEVVRGYLVPVDARAPKNTPQAPPIPPNAVSTVRDDRTLSVRLSGGLVYAGNFPSLGAVTLGAAKQFGRVGIEVSAVAAVPRAEAWCGGGGVGVRYALLDHTRPISVVVSGGVAGLAVAYQEDGKKWTTKAAALPYVDLAIGAVIIGPLAARVDGMIGAAIPAADFKSKIGSDVRFGSSVAGVSAGVELVW
jgi:hypothetical protein